MNAQALTAEQSAKLQQLSDLGMSPEVIAAKKAEFLAANAAQQAQAKAPEVALTVEQMRKLSPKALKAMNTSYKDFKPFENLVVTVHNVQVAEPKVPVDPVTRKVKQPHYFTEKVVAETGKSQDGKIYLNPTEAFMCAAIAGQLVNSQGDLVTREQFVALFSAGSEEVLEIKALGFSANKCLVELQGLRCGLKIEA